MGWIHGLKLVAVAIIAHAIFDMSKNTLDKMALVDCFIDIDNSVNMDTSICTNRSNIDSCVFRFSTAKNGDEGNTSTLVHIPISKPPALFY